MYDTAVVHRDAVRLLHELSGPDGIRASLTPVANYGAVFTRDAVMAGIAGLLTEDSTVLRGLVRTLEHLRALQGTEGQIPSNFTPREGSPPAASFGTLVPRIDAPLWYMIGVSLAARAGAIDPASFAESIRAVVRMLDTLEYNGKHLVYVPVGGDWADEYILEGYVLHDQVLRAWALGLAGKIFAEPRWRDKAARIEEAIETNFWPAGRDELPYPIASCSPARVQDIFDLASCSLLAVAGIAPGRTGAMLDWIVGRFLERRELPPAFHPVIDEAHADWPALARYHVHGFRNRPHEYHNGGVWPIWLGWFALALAHAGRARDVAHLDNLAHEQMHSREFAFQEYLHGATGAPGGVAQMAYTATGIVLLDVAGGAPSALLVPTR